jgi:uncharacterized protein YoaH (UPF0181 family)
MTDPTTPPAPEGDRPPVRPFADELRIKLSTSNNRVAGFMANLLEQIERSFPGTAIEEVERLRQEAIDAADAIALVAAEWRDTAPLRDIRARATAEQEPTAGPDISTHEGMVAHLQAPLESGGHRLPHITRAPDLPMETLEGLHAADHQADQDHRSAGDDVLNHLHLADPDDAEEASE